MSTVFAALAVSVDGFITGSDPRPGLGLGDGRALFDWYEQPENAPVYKELVARVGAVVTGRTTYDHSCGFDGGSPHPTAPMVVVSNRAQPAEFSTSERQSFADSIESAIAQAHTLAGDKDVAIQGGVTLTNAIQVGLVDELILHQVPVLLGAGRPFFGHLRKHIQLTLVDAVTGVGVTHLSYRIEK